MYYFDTSALTKLVIDEAETAALRRFITTLEPADLVTSSLARAELLRAASRSHPETVRKAREILDGLAEITMTEALLDAAGVVEPPTLRTLDAIHLATAMELGEELRGIVAYDLRLLDSARLAGLAVCTPS